MAEKDERRARLDQPVERTRNRNPMPSSEDFGRLSERIARFIGSWKFIAWMTGFIALWIGWNTIGPRDWRVDPYAFLFLTLLLSLQASYAAPLILLAQNRQTDRDRVQYQDDRERTDRLMADTEFVVREVAALRLALANAATRDFIRGELRDLLEELERLQGDPSSDDAAEGRGRTGPAQPA